MCYCISSSLYEKQSKNAVWLSYIYNLNHKLLVPHKFSRSDGVAFMERTEFTLCRQNKKNAIFLLKNVLPFFTRSAFSTDSMCNGKTHHRGMQYSFETAAFGRLILVCCFLLCLIVFCLYTPKAHLET